MAPLSEQQLKQYAVEVGHQADFGIVAYLRLHESLETSVSSFHAMTQLLSRPRTDGARADFLELTNTHQTAMAEGLFDVQSLLNAGANLGKLFAPTKHTIRPVSYTHLDVYKRQVRPSS